MVELLQQVISLSRKQSNNEILLKQIEDLNGRWESELINTALLGERTGTKYQQS